MTRAGRTSDEIMTMCVFILFESVDEVLAMNVSTPLCTVQKLTVY